MRMQARTAISHWILGIVPALALAFASGAPAHGQDLGAFMPHDGGVLTTAWTNGYGPDAESWIRFEKVTPESIGIDYSSSRGTKAARSIRVSDRATARAMVLGYGPKMPPVIENSTSLGTSTAVLDELRNTGRAKAALVYNAALAVMQGEYTLAGQGMTMPLLVEGQVVQVPVVHATGAFAKGKTKAEGDFYFLDNRNNPILIQYRIQFTGEKSPRTERVVEVSAGASYRDAMEQALAAKRTYDLYGIHFDFGKATIRPDAASLLDQIATALNNNRLWTLKIVGHTDSIGDPVFNQKLSRQRADAIKAALIKRGIAEARLTTNGAGQAEPKATNETLEGRAINRRVELARTDR
jgi:outer membrane protein OmpA-like peptidoglycan-associated protein